MQSTIFVFIAVNICDLSLQSRWSYEDESHWGGACASSRQSPINIQREAAITDGRAEKIRGPLIMNGYEAVTLTALNNGHTLKWKLSGNSPPPILSGGPLLGNYSFLQFHLHWLSEHAIDGLKYALEIHMVHIKYGLSIAEAISTHDGLAVIGILYQVRNTDDNDLALQDIMPAVPFLTHGTSAESAAVMLDLRRLFSPDMQSYFTYSGSLTTPNCSEAVTWIVMDQPVTMSDTQFKILTKVDVGGVTNFRSIQPLNDRKVYRPANSCTFIKAPNLTSYLTAILACSSTALSGVLKKGVCLMLNLKKKILNQAIVGCSIETD